MHHSQSDRRRTGGSVDVVPRTEIPSRSEQHAGLRSLSMSVPTSWRYRRARADLARVPGRPPPLSVIRPLIEVARNVGVDAEELDDQHVELTYDARDRDQWLAVDAIYEAVYRRSTTEGDMAFDSGPDNWVVIHFDYGACGRKGSSGRSAG